MIVAMGHNRESHGGVPGAIVCALPWRMLGGGRAYAIRDVAACVLILP